MSCWFLILKQKRKSLFTLQWRVLVTQILCKFFYFKMGPINTCCHCPRTVSQIARIVACIFMSPIISCPPPSIHQISSANYMLSVTPRHPDIIFFNPLLVFPDFDSSCAHCPVILEEHFSPITRFSTRFIVFTCPILHSNHAAILLFHLLTQNRWQPLIFESQLFMLTRLSYWKTTLQLKFLVP